ncbi:YozE family protein [Flavitalea sp. BT771]|uniref:YozE family protein n=1 Tax=Flavitalea sp. BT771 TaxID=3063329 RepID=UPI0026E20A0A|nr:YozE family protein [Flavitalea sp. BT771]MDO6435583.1 YozE family protein [Flavitalea sp. BT771]MDV6224483.1 YozE family protein [Flavitalea sp. BT771]
MTIVEFIKSNLAQNTPMGDLCRDIQGDPGFPSNKSEEEVISYLQFRTSRGGTDSVLKKMLRQYEMQRATVVDTLDVETRFAVLRTERWNFLKESFLVDKVHLVGKPTDIYKVYCIDSMTGKALLFDIKSKKSLNDLNLMDAAIIFIGELTQIVTVSEAVRQLENCSYDTPVKPYMPNFQELIVFLKQYV